MVANFYKRFLLIIIFYSLERDVFAQTFNSDSLLHSISVFQQDLNTEYKDSLSSPLAKHERLVFSEHTYFPANLEFCVFAKFVITPEEKPFGMQTTTERKPMYVKYGEVVFLLKGKKYKLNVYQSMDLIYRPGYEDYLIIPYKDLTNGKLTYGGGRYIDLSTKIGNRFILDFNKSYNPYCAYNHTYSCPVPPPENFLELEVLAGIKSPKE